MNLAINIEQFQEEPLIFCDPIKNNIMNEGNFVRILYSTNVVTLNGVYISFFLSGLKCDKYYNKFKCSFNEAFHKDTLELLRSIEERILQKYKTTKSPTFKIYEQLKTGYLKLFTDVGYASSCTFLLKISGIWETQTQYGLTYKFLPAK